MKIRVEFEHDGQVARVVLAAPKANIVDQAMMADLESAFESLASRRDLKAIVLIGERPNFSFGASVQEHLPEQISGTLTRLNGLLRRIAEAPAPTIAAVRGQCLGGGLELALACDLILAGRDRATRLPGNSAGGVSSRSVRAAAGAHRRWTGCEPGIDRRQHERSYGGGNWPGGPHGGSRSTGCGARAVAGCRFSASLSFSSTLRGAGRAPSSDACTGTGLAGNRAALLKGPHE